MARRLKATDQEPVAAENGTVLGVDLNFSVLRERPNFIHPHSQPEVWRRLFELTTFLEGSPDSRAHGPGSRTCTNSSSMGGYSPVNIADQLDMTLSEIYTALAYYHEHPELDAERQSRHAPEPPHCR